MLTVVAMETVHHDYRPTFVHFCKKSMLNDDVAIVYRAFFTKRCMRKIQHVCGEHKSSQFQRAFPLKPLDQSSQTSRSKPEVYGGLWSGTSVYGVGLSF